MPNVCHIVSGDLWAGAEVVVRHLLGGLQAAGDVRLRAILLNEGRLAAEIRALGIRTHVLEERALSFPGILRRARHLLREDPPDILHAHRYKENALAFLLRGSSPRSKLVATQHGLPEIYPGMATVKNRAVSRANFLLMSRCFHSVVAVSHDIRWALLNRLGFRDATVRVIHNGIELPSSMPGKPEHGPFVVGSCGRLVPVKDYPLMVEIAKAVAAMEPRIRFHLAGDGPERARLEAMVAAGGIENTFALLGHCEEMARFYGSLSVYLCTSRHEGMPMSVLEAMSLGNPVVAPAVGGLREMVRNGENGILLRTRSPEDYARAILGLYRDAETRKRMSRAARWSVEREFSVDRMIRGHVDLYRELCRSR